MLCEHVDERARLLADRHHLRHHRREDLGLRERAGERRPCRIDSWMSRTACFDLPVVRRLPDDRERLDDRHAGVQHHRQVAANRATAIFVVSLPKIGQLELDRVDDAPHLLGVLVGAPPDHRDDDDDRDQRAATHHMLFEIVTRICVGSGSD